MGGWVRCLQDEKNRNTLGKKGTFVVHVQYLENSTWQGEIRWVEKGKNVSFRSELELLKLMDNALEMKCTVPVTFLIMGQYTSDTIKLFQKAQKNMKNSIDERG